MSLAHDGTPVNKLIKYVLFFFNFAVFLLSGAVTGLMIWILAEKDKVVKNAFDFFLDPACVLCLACSVTFVVSLAGWFGSLRENILALTIYRYCLMALFLVEFTFIILIFVIVYVPKFREQTGIYPENSLKTAVLKYRDDVDMQNLIDGIQEELRCCGTSNDDEGYKDWSENAYFNCSSGTNPTNFGEYCSVPFSCCVEPTDGLMNLKCGSNMQSTEVNDITRKAAINTRGCFRAITSILEDNVLVVGGIIMGILVPQMFLMCIAGKFVEQIERQMAKWNRIR